MRTQRFRECEWCGFSFPIKRETAKYCSSAHRTAAYEARKREEAQADVVAPVPPEPEQLPEQPPTIDASTLLAAQAALAASAAPRGDDADEDEPAPQAPQEEPGALTDAVATELRERQRLETPLGRALLVLAHRLDHSQGESGSSVARLVQELRATRNAALDIAAPAAAGGGGDGGPVDPLEARRLERERRREAAGS